MEEQLRKDLAPVLDLAQRTDFQCLRQWEERYLAQLRGRLVNGNPDDDSIVTDVRRWQGIEAFVKYIENESARADRFFSALSSEQI